MSAARMSAGAVKVEAELTPPFSGEFKPVHIGVYKRSWPNGMPLASPFYLWDGREWRGRGDSSVICASRSQHRARCQNWPWRGLAADPSKAAK